MKKGTYFVVELLKNLNKIEQDNLKAFVECKFFNKDKKVPTLLNLILKYVNTDKILDDQVLTAVYNNLSKTSVKRLTIPQRGYIYAKMSLLFNLIQQFITIIALQKNEKTKADLLQQQLLKRKLDRNYNKFIKTQRNNLKSSTMDIEFYEHQFVIENSTLDYAQQKGNLGKQNNINLVKDSLTQYYLLHQLDLYLVELYLSETFVHQQVNTLYYQALKPLLNLPQFKEHPLFRIYQSVINLWYSKTESAFSQLTENLAQYGSTLPVDSLLNFYNTLLNFCILQIREGKPEYNQKQFELYKKMDEKNLLFINNQIHIGNLHNIVRAACIVNKYEWANKMLDKYYTYLPINLRKEVKNYNLGAIAYYTKNYQLAIDYLFPLPPINQTHDINRRSLMIKAFYELDTSYKETTHTLFRSFEKYIREHKNLTTKSKTSYKNFIRTLINLYRIKHSVTKMQLSNLKQKLSTQKLNSNKTWLQEKIAELEI